MDAEIIPFPPNNESILNTLESARECFDLAEAIDSQINFWKSQAHAPSMRLRSLAQSIAEDCAPLEHEPKEYREEVTFGSSMTLGDATNRTAYEKRRALLTPWVQQEALDTLTPHNEAYSEYFQKIIQLGEASSVPEQFKVSTRAVRRLFLLREQLTVRIGATDTMDMPAFVEVMNRLLTETF